MSSKISRDIKHAALTLVVKGRKQEEIAKSLGISDRTIHRAKFKLHHHGDIEGGAKKAGPKPKMTPQMEDVNSL